jgi:hypothetical protein
MINNRIGRVCVHKMARLYSAVCLADCRSVLKVLEQELRSVETDQPGKS